jgi:hypothetical protein
VVLQTVASRVTPSGSVIMGRVLYHRLAFSELAMKLSRGQQ